MNQTSQQAGATVRGRQAFAFSPVALAIIAAGMAPAAALAQSTATAATETVEVQGKAPGANGALKLRTT